MIHAVWKLEPETPVPHEKSKLFQQLVYRALGEHGIPESKTAEFLGIPMMSFYKQRQIETSDDAPISGANILIVMESGDLLERLFQLPMLFRNRINHRRPVPDCHTLGHEYS